MYHLLGTVAAGAALSDGSAAIEPFCSALSKQHIFLVCARLVLVPCILPHGLTLHMLFSSCRGTACVLVFSACSSGAFPPPPSLCQGTSRSCSCWVSLSGAWAGGGIAAWERKPSEQSWKSKNSFISLVERAKCQLGTV